MSEPFQGRDMFNRRQVKLLPLVLTITAVLQHYASDSATACSQKTTADAPGSAVLRNASSGTYDDLPAPAFMLFVFSAPSAAADAAAWSAAAMLPPEQQEWCFCQP